MSKKIKWSEIPASLKVGAGLGLAAGVVALLVPLEIKMIFFVVSLFLTAWGFRDQGVRFNYRLHGLEIVADEANLGPRSFTIGLALGAMPIWVVTVLFAFWNWFGWWLVGTVAVVLTIIFQEKIKEAYYFIADRIGEKWYGSRAQGYFLDHQATICLFVGMLILVLSLVAVISTAAHPSLLKIIIMGLCMVVGAVIAFIGIGIRSVEND